MEPLDQDQVQMQVEALAAEVQEEILLELQDRLIQVLEVEDLMQTLMELQVLVEKEL